jgi:hypothetical protein
MSRTHSVIFIDCCLVARLWHISIFLIVLLFLHPLPAYSQSAVMHSNPWQVMSVVVLQGLDKITARVSKFEIEVDKVGYFGTLNIKVRACRKKPPTEPPEKAAFLEITDLKLGENATELYKGWMFASSPGLSSLEHPVYDVWVLDCKKRLIQSKSSE